MAHGPILMIIIVRIRNIISEDQLQGRTGKFNPFSLVVMIISILNLAAKYLFDPI